eukprot:Clim_evm10s222 gene=Clim_evmTU10s222
MTGELKIQRSDRVAQFPPKTVWHEFTPMSVQYKSVNLGQGFPDWPSPPFVIEAAHEALNAGHNQYARSAGALPLVKILADQYSKRLNRESINPLTEVMVSVGVTQGLYAAIQSFVNPGDEVIVMEPSFDIYVAQLKMAGGVPRYLPLHPPKDADHKTHSSSADWTVDLEELKALLNPKTKAIIINSPHNPLGKVFSEKELLDMAKVLESWPQVVVFSDEVYEHITYKDTKMVRTASLPGMWDRTLTFSSAGKTFSVTGWKIGWVIGPASLVSAVTISHAWSPFSVATPLQEAVAMALIKAEDPYGGFPNYYEYLRAEYTRKREKLITILDNAGLHPTVPQGGFFIMANISEARKKVSQDVEKELQDDDPAIDWAFCRYLTKQKGVTAIPPSAFYCKENAHIGSHYARFAFCKMDESLDEAEKRLKL